MGDGLSSSWAITLRGGASAYRRPFRAIGAAIESECGWIDKDMGDGLLAVFSREVGVKARMVVLEVPAARAVGGAKPKWEPIGSFRTPL